MNLNGIQRNYDLLTPHERFIAVLAAHARGDDHEITSLVRTCPRQSYSGSELGYRRRLDAAGRMGDLVIFDVLGKAAAGYLGMDLGHDRKDYQVSILGESLFLAAAAAWQGFRLFCDDIGVNFEGFLTFSSYGLQKLGGDKSGTPNKAASIFEMYLSLLDNAQPEPDEIERARVNCREFWDWAISPECDYV